MPHETLLKFNYPDTLLGEYSHWAVLLRPQQATVGSLVLVCCAEVTSMAKVSAEAFAELRTVPTDLEGTLNRVFAFDKINYLLLMPVDRHGHFHVIPRYATPRTVGGVAFPDRAWPKPPAVPGADRAAVRGTLPTAANGVADRARLTRWNPSIARLACFPERGWCHAPQCGNAVRRMTIWKKR